MALKLLHRGALEQHNLPTKYYEKLPVGSKVTSERRARKHTHTDRLTGDLISLRSFLEIRLKTKKEGPLIDFSIS
jgi:hypothetical protein